MRILSKGIQAIKSSTEKVSKKAFSRVLNTVHNTFGTSSTSDIIKISEGINKDILELRCEKYIFTGEDLLKIIEKHVGKKTASRLDFISSEEEAVKILQSNYNISKEESVDVVKYAAAMVIPGYRNQRNYLYIPQRILYNPSVEDVGTIAHEVEHVVYTSKSLFIKFSNLLSKISDKDSRKTAVYSKISDIVYRFTIERNNQKIYGKLQTLNLTALIKLLAEMKEESRAFLIEDEIYDFINKKYKLKPDETRVSYYENFENTRKMLEEIILKKYLKYIPSSISNFILKTIN